MFDHHLCFDSGRLLENEFCRLVRDKPDDRRNQLLIQQEPGEDNPAGTNAANSKKLPGAYDDQQLQDPPQESAQPSAIFLLAPTGYVGAHQWQVYSQPN